MLLVSLIFSYTSINLEILKQTTERSVVQTPPHKETVNLVKGKMVVPTICNSFLPFWFYVFFFFLFVEGCDPHLCGSDKLVPPPGRAWEHSRITQSRFGTRLGLCGRIFGLSRGTAKPTHSVAMPGSECIWKIIITRAYIHALLYSSSNLPKKENWLISTVFD